MNMNEKIHGFIIEDVKNSLNTPQCRVHIIEAWILRHVQTGIRVTDTCRRFYDSGDEISVRSYWCIIYHPSIPTGSGRGIVVDMRLVRMVANPRLAKPVMRIGVTESINPSLASAS
ncbi:hypothetical protein AVEN_115115-1 [Araneus ventricosus]|uniref:Uncharacterized protein n=1 Tax=Araneus ventricosus TaxID=182803 RepID=A0A4Y1ZXV6_ARAVE|nr:hypothetical protein AVEN_115115-1 [Araneus ventricosus]